MISHILSLALALAASQPELAGASSIAVEGSLGATVKKVARVRSPVWIAWTVPAVPGKRYTCCLSRDWKPATCRLEGKEQSSGSSEGRGFPEPDGNLKVLARLAGGKVGRVRAVSGNCPVDFGAVSAVHLSGVDPAQSVSWLHEVAQGDRTKQAELGEDAAGAIALHRNASADAALADLASPRYVSELRGQALFWLAERGQPAALPIILATLEEDPDEEVREQAVFALSELPKGEGIPHLVRIAREHRDREIRRQAILCLTESDDPRAAAFLDQILED
jgi:hypothetical protein